MEDAKNGYLERKVQGKKAHFLWFTLSGSTLFAYSKNTSATPKATYQLNGCEVTLNAKDFTLTLTNPEGKEFLKLTATGKNDADSWFEVIKSSKDKSASDAPVKAVIKESKVSLPNRTIKNLSGKIVVSGAVKSTIKNIVNEETKLLLVALKRIIAKVENQKKAEEIENNIMKILTKAYFLDRDKIINTDDFDQVDEPMRETFEILVYMRDYRERLKPSTVEEKFKTVQVHLKKIEEIVTNLLINHISGNSTAKIGVIFGLLGSINFLNEAWSDESIDDERNLLADAMNRYTQFH